MERIRQLRPDIICLDVILPDSEGLDLLRWVRSTVPESAVLMVTACSDMTTYNAAMEIGASGFITKPFNPAMVLDTLTQVRGNIIAKRENRNLVP
jgi:two-component system chemotaxis response regulator CheY